MFRPKLMYPLTVMSIFLGCAGQAPRKAAFDERSSFKSGPLYVFRDRHHPTLEHSFFFKAEELFVRVAEFPGYDQPKWYLLNPVPETLTNSLSRWITIQGEPSPAFPSHEWYSRTTYPPDTNTPPQTVYFRARTPVADEIEKWFRELRSATIQQCYRTWVIPRWLNDELRIDKRFGLGGKPSL